MDVLKLYTKRKASEISQRGAQEEFSQEKERAEPILGSGDFEESSSKSVGGLLESDSATIAEDAPSLGGSASDDMEEDSDNYDDDEASFVAVTKAVKTRGGRISRPVTGRLVQERPTELMPGEKKRESRSDTCEPPQKKRKKQPLPTMENSNLSSGYCADDQTFVVYARAASTTKFYVTLLVDQKTFTHDDNGHICDLKPLTQEQRSEMTACKTKHRFRADMLCGISGVPASHVSPFCQHAFRVRMVEGSELNLRHHSISPVFPLSKSSAIKGIPVSTSQVWRFNYNVNIKRNPRIGGNSPCHALGGLPIGDAGDVFAQMEFVAFESVSHEYDGVKVARNSAVPLIHWKSQTRGTSTSVKASQQSQFVDPDDIEIQKQHFTNVFLRRTTFGTLRQRADDAIYHHINESIKSAASPPKCIALCVDKQNGKEARRAVALNINAGINAADVNIGPVEMQGSWRIQNTISECLHWVDSVGNRVSPLAAHGVESDRLDCARWLVAPFLSDVAWRLARYFGFSDAIRLLSRRREAMLIAKHPIAACLVDGFEVKNRAAVLRDVAMKLSRAKVGVTSVEAHREIAKHVERAECLVQFAEDMRDALDGCVAVSCRVEDEKNLKAAEKINKLGYVQYVHDERVLKSVAKSAKREFCSELSAVSYAYATQDEMYEYVCEKMLALAQDTGIDNTNFLVLCHSGHDRKRISELSQSSAVLRRIRAKFLCGEEIWRTNVAAMAKSNVHLIILHAELFPLVELLKFAVVPRIADTMLQIPTPVNSADYVECTWKNDGKLKDLERVKFAGVHVAGIAHSGRPENDFELTRTGGLADCKLPYAAELNNSARELIETLGINFISGERQLKQKLGTDYSAPTIVAMPSQGKIDGEFMSGVKKSAVVWTADRIEPWNAMAGAVSRIFICTEHESNPVWKKPRCYSFDGPRARRVSRVRRLIAKLLRERPPQIFVIGSENSLFGSDIICQDFWLSNAK